METLINGQGENVSNKWAGWKILKYLIKLGGWKFSSKMVDEKADKFRKVLEAKINVKMAKNC